MTNKTIFFTVVILGVSLVVLSTGGKPEQTKEITVEAQTLVKPMIEASEAELAEAKMLEQASHEASIAPEPEPAPEPIKEDPKPTTVATRSFRMNDGTYKTGQELLDYGHSDPNAKKLWQAFFDRYGQEVADTALITLFYENGTFKPDTVGVCSFKYQVNGDYRNCVYADMNTEGMDAGLKQINTYYQRYRIAKLGGEACEPSNSRDITDPCTASHVQWLKNVDNNIMIALDIYAEQGFIPWIGYKRAFNN